MLQRFLWDVPSGTRCPCDLFSDGHDSSPDNISGCPTLPTGSTSQEVVLLSGQGCTHSRLFGRGHFVQTVPINSPKA